MPHVSLLTKSALLALALLSAPFAARALDTDPDAPNLPPPRPISFDRPYRTQPTEEAENFDRDYDFRGHASGYDRNNGFHPTLDLIRVNITHVIHNGPKKIQSLQLPAVRLVSGQKAMVKVNDRRYRIYAVVKPSGKVDVSLAYLKRGNFSVQSDLLMEKMVTLQPKKSGAIAFGNEEFRINTDVSSREENQWLHYERRYRFSSGSGSSYGTRSRFSLDD